MLCTTEGDYSASFRRRVAPFGGEVFSILSIVKSMRDTFLRVEWSLEGHEGLSNVNVEGMVVGDGKVASATTYLVSRYFLETPERVKT